jgi:hypothetical protein
MGVTHRFIEAPNGHSAVVEWFRSLPSAPDEMKTEWGYVFFFSQFGDLIYDDNGYIDSTKSPVVNVFLPRIRRGILWTVGEVHFRATPLKQRFAELNKVNGAFKKWLSSNELIFSNSPSAENKWNYHLEGSTRNYDPPIFALVSGADAIRNGQYFVADDDTEVRLDKICASLRLRGLQPD